MANLKADLDDYLSKSGGGGGGRKASSLTSLAQSFSLPTLKSPFGGGGGAAGDDTEILIDDGVAAASGWFGAAQPKKDCLPNLSKKQRIVGFMGCIIMGLVCFVLSWMYFSVLLWRKFSLLFSLGSLFTMSSFSLLWGPCNHFRHLISKERLPFTSIYILTLFGTLYFALGLQSTILTIVAAAAQILALVWFIVSYIPGGQTGLKFFTRICSSLCKSTVGRSLPV